MEITLLKQKVEQGKLTLTAHSKASVWPMAFHTNKAKHYFLNVQGTITEPPDDPNEKAPFTVYLRYFAEGKCKKFELYIYL